MQIPILSGIYTDSSPDVRAAYPVNLIPFAEATSISKGYLKPADGIVQDGTGPGLDRGGINWNGLLYRVMGSKLVSIDENGAVTELGDVEDDGKLVTLDYSFDRLSIASNEKLFYWDGTVLTEVTDPDLGTVLDQKFIDGYFMTTDGEFLVVTELSDPTSVNPAKYGSSEVDPDPVVALLALRNEIHALNRYTIEVFDNVGGEGFPFRRIDGAQMQKGCVGTHACCVYLEQLAFLGGGRNEQPGVYIGANGRTQKLSSKEIDEVLDEYPESELALVKLEARNYNGNQLLYIHLSDKTLVFDYTTSQATGQQVWFILSSGINEISQYRAKNFVYIYDKWHVADVSTAKIGYFDDTIGEHWGEVVTWEFGTNIIYNEGNGAAIHELELATLTGRIAVDKDPRISTSYSTDGVTWSQDRYISVGGRGNRNQRIVWFKQGILQLYRMQRFRGDSYAHLSFIRLEAKLEPFNR